LSDSAIHINQISYIHPLLSTLRYFGVNLEKLKNKSLLKHFNIEDVNSYVPAIALEGFLNNVFHTQGLDYMDNSFSNQFKLQDMGEFGEYLVQLPNSLAALDESIKLEPLIMSNCRTKLIIKGKESLYHWKFHNRKTRGRTISEEFCFLMVLVGLQYVLGKNFLIKTIAIPHYMYPVLKHNLPDGEYDFQFTQDTYSVGFPTLSITSKIGGGEILKDRPELFSDSYRIRLSFLMNGLEEGIMPSEKLLSEILGVSERSLRRKLVAEGASFRELSREHLLTSSIEQLETTERGIDEISESLGYEHVTNFIRAFKSWTGQTPLQYRFSI